MLFTILIVLLVVMLIGGLPTWPYARTYGYGYFPSGIAAVLLVILVLLLLFGRI